MTSYRDRDVHELTEICKVCGHAYGHHDGTEFHRFVGIGRYLKEDVPVTREAPNAPYD